ncbi:MAG: DUF115 domain-containing protein [Treponema sp.]|nr:DUF115 domain-containing protein [Treponema sp.]
MQGKSVSAKPALIKNGITVVSGIDPASRAEKSVDFFSLKERTLYFCPSPIFGYGLSRLLSRLEKEAPDSAVLCIESDKELYELTKINIDASLFKNKRLHITNICEGIKLFSLVCDIWGARAFRRVETIRLTGGWQLSPDLYKSLYDCLRREIANDWSNAMTLAKLGRLYIRNALRNLAVITQFSSVVNLSYGRKPVLVLGAGPSLDDVLDALYRNFSHAAYAANALNSAGNRPFNIICADTCLGALKDRNVVPDLVVILESQHWNLRDFIGCKGWNVPVAADLSALPSSVSILGKEGYLFMTPWTTLRIFNRLNKKGLLPTVIQPLGSVGLTAVEIARGLTKGIIICAGLDFSFTADMYHCKSAPDHRTKLNTQNRFKGILNNIAYAAHSYAVSSKSGFPVFSSSVMRNYLNLFKQEFCGDSRLFDIEGSGLSLGLKTLSMEEALYLLTNNPNIVPQEDTETKEEKGVRSPYLRANKTDITYFLECEIKLLRELRCLLTGEGEADRERLCVLVDECDYLWAHFPDYSGGRKGNLEDTSFLNRIRAELDPMIKLIEQTMKEI